MAQCIAPSDEEPAGDRGQLDARRIIVAAGFTRPTPLPADSGTASVMRSLPRMSPWALVLGSHPTVRRPQKRQRTRGPAAW
jgi:hypothetical protein